MGDIVFQIDNLRAGDLVLFVEGDDLSGPLPDTMGFVVDDCPRGPSSPPAVLIQFYGGADTGPLHYYHHELYTFLEQGSIRIQHAS